MGNHQCLFSGCDSKRKEGIKVKYQERNGEVGWVNKLD